MKILLVEPAYKTKYPSVGLMRISAYHKSIGDKVEYVRGSNAFVTEPNRIYVTSIFTYHYKFVKEAIQFYRMRFPKSELWLGGIAATLIPEKFKGLGIDCIHKGLYEPAEDCVPDYSLHPKINESILLTQRGCIRKCPWCVSREHDGLFKAKKNIEKYIIDKFPKISAWDNNFLVHPDFFNVVDILAKYNKEIDFNQSLDIRLLTEKKALALKKLNIYPLRFSFDDIKYKKEFLEGVKICKKVGFKQEVRVDVLYNYMDTPKDFYQRMKIVLNSNFCPYPMRFKPIKQVDKAWLSPNWTQAALDKWAYFCKAQLGRQGDFFNPRCYIYFKGERIKMDALFNNITKFRKQLSNMPSKESQTRYRKNLLNKQDQEDFWD